MRIHAGLYKGRVIESPKGIRPTQDKVRKALFDILGDIQGASFLELCAGSGSVGLEAASRGAKEVVFVEQDRRNLRQLKQNIVSLGLREYHLYAQDAQKAVKQLHSRRILFEFIFLDPPYYTDLAKKILQIIGAYDIVTPAGQVIIQHFKKARLPEKIERFELFRQNHYGDSVLSFYGKHK